MHPLAGVVFRLDPFGAPEPDRGLALREPFRLAFERQQELAVAVVPRARPGRGSGAPSQTSSMCTTSRIRCSPPSSGKTVPAGKRTCIERPGPSILSISAPSSRRSPVSAVPLSAASRTSGAAPRATRPSVTPALTQKGASGSAAQGSSQAAYGEQIAMESWEAMAPQSQGFGAISLSIRISFSSSEISKEENQECLRRQLQTLCWTRMSRDFAPG